MEGDVGEANSLDGNLHICGENNGAEGDGAVGGALKGREESEVLIRRKRNWETLKGTGARIQRLPS